VVDRESNLHSFSQKHSSLVNKRNLRSSKYSGTVRETVIHERTQCGASFFVAQAAIDVLVSLRTHDPLREFARGHQKYHRAFRDCSRRRRCETAQETQCSRAHNTMMNAVRSTEEPLHAIA
jgi:hypothetical protein